MSTIPLIPLARTFRRSQPLKRSILVSVLALTSFAICTTYLVLTPKEDVDVEESASIPLSLSPQINSRTFRYDPSLAVDEVAKLLSNRGHAIQTMKDMNTPIGLSNEPSFRRQHGYVLVEGEKFLRTPLLDAVWDYHESANAKALVNQVCCALFFLCPIKLFWYGMLDGLITTSPRVAVEFKSCLSPQAIEEQTIDAANGGDEPDPPEMAAADALERLENGDLNFEERCGCCRCTATSIRRTLFFIDSIPCHRQGNPASLRQIASYFPRIKAPRR